MRNDRLVSGGYDDKEVRLWRVSTQACEAERLLNAMVAAGHAPSVAGVCTVMDAYCELNEVSARHHLITI